jgi:hypothetical protein
MQHYYFLDDSNCNKIEIHWLVGDKLNSMTNSLFVCAPELSYLLHRFKN